MNKIFSNSYFFVLIMLVAFACKKDEDTLPNNFVIYTEEVSEITSDGAKFNARVVNFGDGNVLDYGFVWSTIKDPVFNLSYSYVVSMGTDLESDEFSVFIKSTLTGNKDYYVRSFIKANNKIYYGKTVSFFSLGCSAPKINDFYPDTATWGDTITVIGENFSFKNSENLIKCNEFLSRCLNTTDSSFKFIVPETLNNYRSKISISISGNISYALDSLTLNPPIVTKLSCDSAVYDAVIKVSGKYFKKDMTTLLFNNEEAKIDSINSTSIKTKVPANLTNGWKDINVKVAGNLVNFSKVFNSLTPLIKGVEPDVAGFGDEIVVIGKNFNPVFENNILKLDELIVPINYCSSDTLRFNIPNETSNADGKMNLNLSIGGITANYDNDFILKAPEIESFFPEFVNFGDTVVVLGKNFNPDISLNNLYLNELKLNLLDASGSNIKFIVPFNLKDESGEFSLKIITGQQQDVFSSKLKVKTPIITGLSNTNTVIGDTLTIFGQNFNPVFTNTSVKIETIDAQIISSSSDSLSFIVPFLTENIPNNIYLNVNLQEIQSVDQVSLLTTTINSITPNEGFRNLELKIIGDNFSLNSGYNKVYFNDIEIPIYRSVRDTLVVKISDVISSGIKDIRIVVGRQETTLYGNYNHIEPWLTKTPIAGYYSRQYNAPIGGIGASYSGKGYAGLSSDLKTPFTLFGSSYRKFSEYDPISDTWTNLKDYPRYGSANLFTYTFEDSLYVIAGHLINRYSFTENDWVEKTILNSDYSHQSGFGFENEIFLISNEGKVASYDIYSNSWSNKNDFPDSPKLREGIEVNDKVYMIGTDYSLWEYEPLIDSWINKTRLPFTGLSIDSPCLKIENEIYFFPIGKGIYKYNPDVDRWFVASSKSPNPTRSDYYHIFYDNYFFSIDDKIYMAMLNLQQCCYYQVYEYFYEYDPSLDVFTEVVP